MATIQEALATAIRRHRDGQLQAAEEIYRQILRAQPDHLDALHLLGVVAHQLGRQEMAIEYIGRAIEIKGNVAEFHSNLGKAYVGAGRTAEAAATFRRALELAPANADLHIHLGGAFLELGMALEAIRCLRHAVMLNPDRADAYVHLGAALKQEGDVAEGAKCFSTALTLKPNIAESYNDAGIAQVGREQLSEAEASFRRALDLKPAFIQARSNLGIVLKSQKKLDEAVSCFQQALSLDPNIAEVHSNLAQAYRDQGKLAEAARSFRQAVELQPDLREAHNHLGAVLANEGRLEDAIECFRRALAIDPALAATHNNIGNIHLQLGDIEEAIECFRQALALKQNLAVAHNNLGNAFKEQRRFEESLACYRRALELDPDFSGARYNLGILLLLLGQYEEGWRLYEHRLDHAPLPCRSSRPHWKGERADGLTILIQCEQGAGDTLQFLRYALPARLRAGAARIVLAVNPALVRLLRESCEPSIEIISSESLRRSPAPPFDLHASLMSLPFILGRYEPLEMSREYVRAEAMLRRKWQALLPPGSGLRVGLTWAGNPRNTRDRLRSVQAEGLLPLLEIPGAQFFSLQVGPKITGPNLLNQAGMIDLTNHIEDFADTAALLAEMDLVISVDTVIAHLAGAMGRPVWTLLRFAADWRWGLHPETTLWYPTMRLFRQPRLKDWEPVLREVGKQLAMTAQTGAV